MRPTTPLRLLRSTPISSNTRLLQFSTLEASFSFRPGEFVSLIMNDEDGEFRRSYSIASISETPQHTTAFELVASFVAGGRATRWLWNAPSGTELAFSGPNGQLTFPELLPKRLFLVATGTGVAPYRSMWHQIKQAAHNSESEIHVLFGARTHDEAIFLDDFRALAKLNPRFHFHFCVSRENARQEDEFNGRVNQKLFSFHPDVSTDVVYLCGNPPMVDETYEALKAHGFGAKTVRREKYVFSPT